jgi:hypothetical protein
MPAMATRLLLDERILADGRHSCTYASADGDRVQITDDEGVSGGLSLVAVERVMTKYGLPLDEEIDVAGEALEFSDGRSLRRMRYHSRVDAEGRDYLVWEVPGEAPRAVIATHATAALRYLVARLSATASEI